MTDMRYYVMVFLRTGPNRQSDPHDKKTLQAGHMANIGRLHAEGSA